MVLKKMSSESEVQRDSEERLCVFKGLFRARAVFTESNIWTVML